MTASSAIRQLRAHAVRLASTSIPALSAADPRRASALALRVGPLYANFARQRYDDAALDALFALAAARDVGGRLRALFDGDTVNPTEDRPALHTALRGDLSSGPVARDASRAAAEARQRMRELVAQIEASGVTEVVSVGIGGSDLGPRLMVDALADREAPRLRVHFLSNVDPAAARAVMAALDPARTAVLLVSKSFGTQETLLNGRILREWLGDDSRLYAITANAARAEAAFSIPAARILPMWDWVGGRYSMWSAVGFPIALALGMDSFEALLDGAAEMDAHVLDAPARGNLALWHALTAVWNRNALGLSSHAVLPYADRLRLLPNYLQQLVMESLGKSVRIDGSPVDVDTVPVWWGGVGTDTQHSFFQALHQGTLAASMDLIGVVAGDDGHRDNADALLANLLAQSEALANGRASDDPHRAYPGNRVGTMLLLDALDPRALGALIAMYEHSVYLQGVLWGINPFDQFGVELGKQVADRLLPALRGEGEAADPVTRELIAQLRR
ncbi:glucose-6-phosphate isomerase [Lysobacter arseniciresistens ZS79]|uniref:Glucose-6-phosphate isomerase n=1 Tax=Lysobacter arseniciresistens ZS79 TaxID=913325 RepID=A0A0A0ER03_9GAMM|nr:glucose-6-phosphate isomerase [Lysobacter arseniciresistens]KGM53381.1 glucose-6-phosphate isomerase [Lysobacter arseniciresistens ZS79]